MICPIRCFTCGKVLANMWEFFTNKVKNEGEQPSEVLDKLELTRICCRRCLLTHVDLQ